MCSQTLNASRRTKFFCTWYLLLLGVACSQLAIEAPRLAPRLMYIYLPLQSDVSSGRSFSSSLAFEQVFSYRPNEVRDDYVECRISNIKCYPP